MANLKTETVPIADLLQDPANARRHSQRNLESIAGSLQRFGQQKPIVIDKANVVRAGNGTLEAARSLGWEKIAAVRTNLTGAEASAFAIADNRTAELAEWDDDILKATLEALADEDTALLESCGYTESELGELIKSCGVFDVDEVEPPSLAVGDREPFQQMTFTLHDEQVELLRSAIDKAKSAGPFDGPNENSNGNALARIAEAYSG